MFPILPPPFQPPYWISLLQPSLNTLVRFAQTNTIVIQCHVRDCTLSAWGRCQRRKRWQSSLEEEEASEQLLIFIQGNHGAAEYALEFCTISTCSGWIKPTLKATFCHGFNDDILTEMAFYNWLAHRPGQPLGQFTLQVTKTSTSWLRCSMEFTHPPLLPQLAFSFIEKKDGALQPCIDYRGLN